MNVNSSEITCIRLMSRTGAPTSHRFNEPHERAESRLAVNCNPIFYADRCQYIEKALSHFFRIRDTNEEELRWHINNVSAVYASVKSSGIDDGNGYFDDEAEEEIYDLVGLIEFEEQVLETLQTFHAYFVEADIEVLVQCLADYWREHHSMRKSPLP